MIILGINAYHPDASVALLKDGALIWAGEEERFNRIKHSSGFPQLALKQCLRDCGMASSDVDVVAISKNPQANFRRKLLFALTALREPVFLANRVKAFRKTSQFQQDYFRALSIQASSVRIKFVHVEHHCAHAASSFFLSGFENAAFLSLDGMGDFSSAMWGHGEGNKLRILDRIYFPHSAGFLYTAGTQFLGFLNFGDEYKVMGLAAYGKPVYVEHFNRMIRLLPKGRFELDLAFFRHQNGLAKVRWEAGKPEQDLMFSERWLDLLGKPRQAQDPITDRDQNIAASLQAVLEEIYFHILNHLHEVTHQENLCLAGGVAFNSVANGKIASRTSFRRVFIQPAAGDAGTAIGAAAYADRALYNRKGSFKMTRADYGNQWSEAEIKNAIEAKGMHLEKLTEDALLRKTAHALADGKIVGWFQGRMEFGPRALGHRSILADPRRQEMKDRLNQRIKHRENFRPFAPSVPEEDADQFFEMDEGDSPFMLKVFPVKQEKKSVIPAATHVDGTARVQTVSRDSNPRFWNLLREFGKLTGVPVLLNTSFNENEPIVCSIKDALDCFQSTHMDLLVIENYWIEKQK